MIKRSLLIVALIMISLMSVSPVLAFDFIKGTQRYMNEANFPPNATLTQKVQQYTRNLRMNRDDFLYTHPGTTMQNYLDARVVALACDNQSLDPGFVTDGVPEKTPSGRATMYRTSTIQKQFPAGTWRINYHNCGQSIIAVINAYPVVRNDNTLDYLTIEIIENTITGVFTAWISSEEEGEGYISSSEGITDISNVMQRLRTQIRNLTGVVHMDISI